MLDILCKKELKEKAKELGFKEVFVIDENIKFIEEKDFPKIQKLKKGYANFISKGTRKAFENPNIKFIIPLNENSKDHTHYRNSGMDQILAKIAKEKNKTIIFEFSELLKAKNKQQILGRWMQNIRLCKKYKVGYEICSMAKDALELRAANDLKAIKRVLTD